MASPARRPRSRQELPSSSSSESLSESVTTTVSNIQSLLKSMPAENSPTRPRKNTTTLNPHVTSFTPQSALSTLGEVEHEALVTPIDTSFSMQPNPSQQKVSSARSIGGFSAAGFTDFSDHEGGMTSPQQQFAALYNQQPIDPAYNPVLAQQQQQLAATLQAQALSLAQMQAALQQNLMQQSPQQAPNVPPRFAQRQNNEPEQNPFLREQLAIQAQYEQLAAQQQDLLNRFQGLQLASNAAGVGLAGPITLNTQIPTTQTTAPSPQSARTPTTHRRHQSHQVNSMANQMGNQLNPFGGFQGGAMSGFAPQPSVAPINTQSLPKGHGRRHSVNVVKSAGPMSATSNPGSGYTPTTGQLGSAFAFPPPADLLTRAAPGNGFNGLENEYASPMSAAPRSGFVPGHGRKGSRGSIGSLAGWGTNSNTVIQSTVAPTQTTDLAQAQAQLLQITQFRNSAGHARAPSFGGGNVSATPGQPARRSLFAPYLPAGSIPPLLATGNLVMGTLRVNKRNRSDAYVSTDVLDADVFICGSKDRNRALEGDMVAVELLDVDTVWSTKKDKEDKKRKKEESTSFDPKFAKEIRKADKKKDDVEVEGQGLGLFEDEEVNDDQKPAYAGHIVAVVERVSGQLFAGTLGILRPSSAATKEKQDAERREREGVDRTADNSMRGDRPKIIWFKPVDKRVPLVAIPADQAPNGFFDAPEDYTNTLFVACIKRWPITSLHPFGSLVEELGQIGDLEVETSALLKDCGFTDEQFADNIIKCTPPVPWNIPANELEARKDYRAQRTFTVDPERAKDLDDALHYKELENGNFEVGVHIADVSYFVKPNTALDREAKKRGCSVYMVQRAAPMLPSTLSEELCSLTPGHDKLTFSVVFELTKDAKIVDVWFGKTVINSDVKLSYEIAQNLLNGKDFPKNIESAEGFAGNGIAQDLQGLAELSHILRKRRFDNGALSIDTPRTTFSLDAETGQPDDCSVFVRKESSEVIEEFMLLANTAVAQKIASHLPEQALLRRHDPPSDRRIELFKERAQRLGFDMQLESSGQFQESLQSIKEHTGTTPHMIVQVLASKSMARAAYFCTGQLDIAKYHHYALNVPLYTHFTSPIRRYADILVHRQLEAAIDPSGDGKFLLDTDTIHKTAQLCNVKKEASRQAAEQSQHLYLCALIQDLTARYGPVVRQAYVVGVMDEAFDVVVPEFGIEKRVHVDQIPILNHVHDARSNNLQLYWKKGVDVVKWLAENSSDPHLQRVRDQAEENARAMEATSGSADAESALFEDEDSGAGNEEEAKKTRSVQRLKSIKKTPLEFENIESTNAGHHIQTINELQNVWVTIIADMTKSPPVIKVLAVNPFK